MHSFSRRALGCLFVIACLFAVLGTDAAITHAHEKPGTSAPLGVARVSLVVRDMARVRGLLVDVLGFTQTGELALGGSPVETLLALPGVSYRVTLLRAGEQRVALVHPSRPGRPIAPDARSNDLAFQHLAIVVGDMDRAYARLRQHHVEAISRGGPQTIPRSNPAAGGIRAFYFRDADRHPLELIWFPKGKGDPRWQRKSDKLALGIDHTAIAVSDSNRSEAFYRDVAGLDVRGHSYNVGPEQEALSDVPGARVRITGLRGESGPGVEFLEYEQPRVGRPLPSDTRAIDDWSSEIELRVPSLERALEAARGYDVAAPRQAVTVDGFRAVRLRDPDGHALRLVSR